MWPARTSAVRLRLLCSSVRNAAALHRRLPPSTCCKLTEQAPGGAGVRSEDAAVEKLLQRLSDGILPDDRREALAQLRDLLGGNPQVRSWASLCSRKQAGTLMVTPRLPHAGAGCARQRRAARAVHCAARRAGGSGDGARSARVPRARSAAQRQRQQQRACCAVMLPCKALLGPTGLTSTHTGPAAHGGQAAARCHKCGAARARAGRAPARGWPAGGDDRQRLLRGLPHGAAADSAGRRQHASPAGGAGTLGEKCAEYCTIAPLRCPCCSALLRGAQCVKACRLCWRPQWAAQG